MSPESPNDWMEYRQYIVRKLDEQSEELAEIRDQVTLLRIDIAMLKVRAGMWGAIAGAVPAVLAVVVMLTGAGQ